MQELTYNKGWAPAARNEVEASMVVIEEGVGLIIQRLGVYCPNN